MTIGPISDSPVPPLAVFVSLYTPSHLVSRSNLRLQQTFLPHTSHLSIFCPEHLKLLKPYSVKTLYFQPNPLSAGPRIIQIFIL